MFKNFLVIILISLNLYSLTISQKFSNAKKEYIQAIISNNKKNEIASLKKIIYYGKLLGKDVKKYKIELSKISKKQIKITNIKKYINEKKQKYDIKKIYSKNNAIVLLFNRKITKNDISFSKFKRKNLYYYNVKIKGRYKKAFLTKIKLKNIYKIKVIQLNKSYLQISLIDKKNLKISYVIFNKHLYITYKILQLSKKIKVLPKIYSNFDYKNKIIVIDPGHGGKDTGAIGPKKRLEKNVVLKIAKYLYYELKKRGFRVYLTRNADYFKSLRYRTHFANKKKADLFISIHANSVKKSRAKYAKGIETYFLSPARSQRAKRAAAIENRAEIAGMNYNTKNIYLNILNRTKIIASQKLGIDIQKNIIYSLKKVYGKEIIDGGVREAPFWVLVGATMPAVLIEVGYISHPIESKRLISKSYQKLIAKAIANGIESYLQKNSL